MTSFDFLLHQERQLHRTCYFFTHHKLFSSLLNTELPYRILEEEGYQVFKDFIKAELHNLQQNPQGITYTVVVLTVKYMYVVT